MARPRKENADYFSHDTNMRSHRKVIALRTKYLLEWYAVYNMLLEHIGSCDYFIAKWDIIEQEIIAGDFGVSVEKLIDIVSFCDRLGLIQIDWETIKCESLTDRLQDLITKRDRERNRVTVTETTQLVAESPQSKVKESKGNKSIVKDSKEEIPSPPKVFINEWLKKDFWKETIEEFSGYRNELSKDGKTRRREKEKFFDVSRRLSTWSKKSFNSSSNTNGFPKANVYPKREVWNRLTDSHDKDYTEWIEEMWITIQHWRWEQGIDRGDTKSEG